MGILGKSGIFGTGTSMGGGGIVIPSNGFKVNITGEGGLSSQLSLVKSAAVNVSGEGGLDADLHNFKSLASNVSGEGGLDGTVTGGGFTGLLDTYPNAAAAYSLRQLSSTYAAPTESEFSFGNALQFDGVNDNVTFTNINVSGITNCSFGFWFKMNIYGTDLMWGSGSNVRVNFPRIISNTLLRVGYEGSGTQKFDFTTPNFDDGNWHHVIITKSGTSYRLYFDGTESTDGVQTITGTVNLNRSGTTYGYFDGYYDEVAFWNATLTPTQVANQYKEGGGNFADIDVTPLLWWKLNESGTDTTAVNSGSGGATYDGTLNNFPASGMWVDGKANKGALVEIAGYATGVFVENKTFYPDENNELSPTSTDAVGTTLANWLSTNSITDGYVRTWYDQSGNANNATQTTASTQPKIITSGAINTLGTSSKPCVNFSDDYLDTPSQNVLTGFLDVYKSWNSTKTGNSLQITIGSTTSGAIYYQYSGTDFLQNGTIPSIDIRDGVHRLTNFYHDSVNGVINHNENNYSAVITGYNNNSTNRVFRIGAYPAGGTWNFIGNLQELIFYSGNQSANKSGIKSNINTFYSIYPDASVSGLLHDYPNAAAAYSLRQLTIYNNGYKAPLVEIRRSSDNAVKTFYADSNNELSLTSEDGSGTSLSSWITTDDGYVRTWYDQSGNAKDFVQTTTSNQPQIISTGALILIDSNKPSILALDDSLLTVPSSKAYFKFLHDGTKSFVSNVLETPSVVSNLEFIWMTQDTGGSDVGADFSINTSEFRQFTRNGGGGAQRNENKWTVTSSSYETVSLTFDADNATAADRVVANVNSGADIATNTRAFAASTADSQNDMHLFNYFVPTSNLGFTGKYQELIFWGSDQSANRTGIETNQNDYYTIYP